MFWGVTDPPEMKVLDVDRIPSTF